MFDYIFSRSSRQLVCTAYHFPPITDVLYDLLIAPSKSKTPLKGARKLSIISPSTKYQYRDAPMAIKLVIYEGFIINTLVDSEYARSVYEGL
jgi:hypothetical protein